MVPAPPRPPNQSRKRCSPLSAVAAVPVSPRTTVKLPAATPVTIMISVPTTRMNGVAGKPAVSQPEWMSPPYRSHPSGLCFGQPRCGGCDVEPGAECTTGDFQRPPAGVHHFVVHRELYGEGLIDRRSAAAAGTKLHEPEVIDLRLIVDMDLAKGVGVVAQADTEHGWPER